MPARFEIKRAKDREYYFNLLAANGEVILTSEMYTTKAAAKKGIASIQANAGEEACYDCRVDKRKKHYFVLRARNNKIIGCSQTYSNNSAMAKGLKSVMKSGATERVADLAE